MKGTIFRDTEIYVLPFLIYQVPRIARNILKFRYDGLDKARARAKELGHRGATFPWRTINGEEASAYYAAGTAQYHINADIAYALRKYVDISGDTDFLIRYGAENSGGDGAVLVGPGLLLGPKGRKVLHQRGDRAGRVYGGRQQQLFYNLMARENLRYAAEVVRWLETEHLEAFRDLTRRTDLREDEVASWCRAADLMYLPYDERLGVHPQDDSFLDKEVWDFAATPEENYPLLLHYHPLNLYRAQVIKQADTLLALFLLGEQFSREEKSGTSTTTTRLRPIIRPCRFASRASSQTRSDIARRRRAISGSPR